MRAPDDWTIGLKAGHQWHTFAYQLRPICDVTEEGSCERLWSLDSFDLKNSSKENGLKDEKKKFSHNGFNKSRFIIKQPPPFSIVALWFPTFCSKSLISNLIVLSLHSLKHLFFLGTIFDWIFRGYWFSVTILSSAVLNSTMLRAYGMLEIYGTVRPAQLECLTLETRIETKSKRSFRLRIALKIPWTDSPYLSHSNVTNFILNLTCMHGFELRGGKHTPTLPPCLLEFEWLSGPLIHNSFITFSFKFLTQRSKWVKLKNCIINPNDKPLSLKRGYQTFNFPFDYRYLSTLKTVLKICAQANVLGLLWYY